MKLKKNVVAFAMAVALGISTVAAPLTVNAEVSNGTYKAIVIDTSAVPTDNKDISIGTDEDNGKYIQASRNVRFELNASVDVTWSVIEKPEDAGDLVSVSEDGYVHIQSNAVAGTYTVRATPKNITNAADVYYQPKIRIIVTTKTAVASSIKLDADVINEHPQMEVTEENGRQKLTITGVVQNEELPVVIEPEYLETVEYYLDNEDKNNSYYKINDLVKISSYKVTGTTAETMNGYVYPHENVVRGSFDVVVKPQKFKFDVINSNSTEVKNEYQFIMNQSATLSVEENSVIALENNNSEYDTVSISDLTWDLKQNNEALSAKYYNEGNEVVSEDDESAKYVIYSVMGYDDKTPQEFATIKCALDNPYSFEVLTADEAYKQGECKDVILTATYKKNGETVKAAKTIKLTFDPHTVDAVSSVYLDFSTYGELDEKYAVKEEVINNKKEKVYYIEENSNAFVDLITATMGDKVGVTSFEESKNEPYCFGTNAEYQIRYSLSDVDGIADAFKNTDIDNAAGVDKYGYITDGQLPLVGIGYKKLTVSVLNPKDYKADSYYIIRYVTSTDDLWNSFDIIRKENVRYDLNVGEVVHVRQGEAVTPTIGNAPVSRVNPYLTYEFSKPGVANCILNENGEYIISGLKSGKVTVTATGAVDKTDSITFDLYVNTESFTTGECNFKIDFFEAIQQGKVEVDSNTYVIKGKQDEVPVNLSLAANSGNAGLPDVTWSLVGVNSDFAEIDAETGSIKAKKATGSKKITVRATSVADSDIYADATITIATVYAKSIESFAEKIEDGKTPVLTSIDGTNGKCKAGSKFTLCASKYSNENATNVEGEIVWSSSNNEVATVEDGGVVTTKSAGQVELTAEYTADGTTKSTIYNLTVESSDVQVTEIQAEDIELTRVADTKAIEATVLPENATDKSLTYQSSDEKIVTVSANGQVTAVAKGDATITITSSNPNVTKTIKVTVEGKADKPVNLDEEKEAAKNAIKAALGTNPSAAAQAIANATIAQIDTATTVEAIEVAKNTAVTSITAQIAADKAAADKAAADKAAADKAAADKAAADKAAADKAAIEKEIADFQKSTVKITSVKNSKGKKIVVKFKKINDAGYQVSYGTKSNFKGAKAKTTSNTSYTIKNLKKGKTYYVRVRAYKTIGGNKVYSKYSSKKKVVIKK